MSNFSAELLQKAAAGDQDAITALYNMTYSSVYKTAKAMIADEDAVLDIVQDSFIKGFQSLEQLDEAQNFRAWMKRIATNKAKDWLKKKKPILFTELANEDGEIPEYRDEKIEHLPEEVLDRKETARLMKQILGSLSEDQRLVIGMFYYEEMGVRQIAELLDCSENTVKSRLNYGRRKIEAKVQELEKKGTKLYSLAPLPFLLWLFFMDRKAEEAPAPGVLDGIKAQCVRIIGTGAKAAVAGAKALAAKIIAAVLAVTMAGGAIAAVSLGNREAPRHTEPPTSGESVPSSPDAETEPASTEAASLPTETTDSELTAYEQVLLDYENPYRTDSEKWLVDPDTYHQQYSYLNTAKLDSYHQYAQFGETDYYYAYADLDGNGIRELLISEFPLVEPHHRIISVYSFDGKDAVELIECGDSNTAELCTDGSIILTEGTVLNGISSVCVLDDSGVYPKILVQHQYDLYADTYQNESQTLSSQGYYETYMPNGSWELEWKLLCTKNKKF